MLRVYPEINLVQLNDLERKTIQKLQKYFSEGSNQARNVKLYLHPDVINGDVDMIIDEHLYYGLARKDYGNHQLWLVKVVSPNNQMDYYSEVKQEANDLYSVKHRIINSTAFDNLQYPDGMEDCYRMRPLHALKGKAKSRHSQKRGNAINTIVVRDSSLEFSKSESGLQDEEVIKNENDWDEHWHQIVHVISDTELSDNNPLFEQVMQQRQNLWTALSKEEYNLTKYFLGFNLVPGREQVKTEELKPVINLVRQFQRVLVSGEAKSGKTTLLVMRVLDAINSYKSITIVSFTYSNLARIRMLLLRLLGNGKSLRELKIQFYTATYLDYKQGSRSDAIFIDCAEDIEQNRLKNILKNGKYEEVFVAQNEDQQVMFQHGNDSASNESLKGDFQKVIQLDKMLNHAAPSIKEFYSNYRQYRQYPTNDVLAPDGQENHIFIYDNIEDPDGRVTLNSNELRIIQGFFSKMYDSPSLNHNGSLIDRVAIISPKFNPLIQVSMFLDQNFKKLKHWCAFSTYAEVLNRQGEGDHHFVDQPPTFEEFYQYLLHEAKAENSVDGAEKVRRLFAKIKKTNNIRDVELHRIIPLMLESRRVVLATLESFKGSQVEKVIAILPDGPLIPGNIETVLSSATDQLIIINNNAEFHNFLVSLDKRPKAVVTKYGLDFKVY